MALQDTDLAYAAGVIDSDGCVSVSRNKTISGSQSFRISVYMTNIEDSNPLWFASKFGGHVGRSFPSNSKVGSRFVPVWKWSLHCRKAADFLELILPYLKIKQQRAKLAIELARKARSHGVAGWSGGQFKKFGYVPLSEMEIQEREDLARGIREANHRSNSRVKMSSKSLLEVN